MIEFNEVRIKRYEYSYLQGTSCNPTLSAIVSVSVYFSLLYNLDNTIVGSCIIFMDLRSTVASVIFRHFNIIESLCKESQQVQLKFMLFLLFTSQWPRAVHVKFLKTIRTKVTFIFTRVHGSITKLEFCTRSLRHYKNDDYQNGLADFLCKAIQLLN